MRDLVHVLRLGHDEAADAPEGRADYLLVVHLVGLLQGLTQLRYPLLLTNVRLLNRAPCQ